VNGSRYGYGFSFIELVVVVVIMGIVAIMIGPLVTQPIALQVQAEDRQEYVTAAEETLARLEAELKAAVPNSVRVSETSSAMVIELMPAYDSARYIAGPSGDDSVLYDSGSDDAFEVVGTLTVPSNGRLVVNPSSATTLYAAASGNTGGAITPTSTTVTITNGNEVTLSTANTFSSSSSKTVWVTQQNPAVTYFCNKSAKTLKRITSYTPSSTIPTDESVSPLSAGQSSDYIFSGVQDCSLSYDDNRFGSWGVITIALEVGSDTNGDKVDLVRQVRVWNAP